MATENKNIKTFPAGSKERPYKCLIVGGGPSGCSVIIRAIRLGLLNDIAVGSNANEAGICLIDKGPAAKFGGGRLQDYIINSNTFANKFVTNIVEDKLESDPPESIKHSCLERLMGSRLKSDVEEYGTKNAPLCTVGRFLSEVGGHIQEALKRFPDSKCYTETEVMYIQRARERDDEGFTSGWKVVVKQGSYQFAGNGDKSQIEIYAKIVVLATGGRQEIPKLPSASHTSKLMSSDDVCTTTGIAALRRRLLLSGKAPKVTIIGGSHSAFSAAWMCLNKVP